MRQINIAIIIFCLALITGCANQIAKLPKYDKSLKNDPQQATIVLRIDNFDYLDLKRVNKGTAEDIKTLALANDEYRVLKPSRLIIPYGYAQTLYTIAPGTYYIASLVNNAEAGVYYSAAPGLDANNVVNYAAFTVKPGDVVYIGDIECQWQSTNKVKKLVMHDKLAEVKKDLTIAGFADLATKMSKAEVYARGSVIPENP